MNKLLVAALSFSAVSGCGSSTILLVHPNTGERVTCQGPVVTSPGVWGGMLATRAMTEDCARQYEGLGFVRAENLTPDQRATLASNPRAIGVKQDLTIQQGESNKGHWILWSRFSWGPIDRETKLDPTSAFEQREACVSASKRATEDLYRSFKNDSSYGRVETDPNAASVDATLSSGTRIHAMYLCFPSDFDPRAGQNIREESKKK